MIIITNCLVYSQSGYLTVMLFSCISTCTCTWNSLTTCILLPTVTASPRTTVLFQMENGDFRLMGLQTIQYVSVLLIQS